MKAIAIIPAKGNSRGLPAKNLKPIMGKPLVAWSIEHAVSSELINEVYVSTDSPEILKVAEEFGAIGVLRPGELARPDSPSEEALLHTLSQIQDLDEIDYVVFLQPTSPIRENGDLDRALKKLADEKGDSLLSVVRIHDHFKWRINERDNFVPINYDYKNRKPRQKIEETFLENGSFYICKRSLLEETKNRLGGKILYYEMPKGYSFQIDDLEDFTICEFLLTKLHEGCDEQQQITIH